MNTKILSCASGSIIYILEAKYGREDCGIFDVKSKISTMCHLKHSCEIAANHRHLGDPCRGPERVKTLKVSYICREISKLIN